MPSKLRIPAISPEVEFLARHLDEAHEIWKGNIKADESVTALLDAVSIRADDDAVELLKNVRGAIDAGLRNLLLIKWGRISVEDWALRGLIYMPRGPKKRICSVGVYIKCHRVPGLVGWVFPRGGLDGRRELARSCEKKVIVTAGGYGSRLSLRSAGTTAGSVLSINLRLCEMAAVQFPLFRIVIINENCNSNVSGRRGRMCHPDVPPCLVSRYVTILYVTIRRHNVLCI